MQEIAPVPCCFPAGSAAYTAVGNGSEPDGRHTRLPLVPSSQGCVRPGHGLKLAPQDRLGTSALAGLAVAALCTGIDTAREGRWALVRCKNHWASPAAP